MLKELGDKNIRMFDATLKIFPPVLFPSTFSLLNPRLTTLGVERRWRLLFKKYLASSVDKMAVILTKDDKIK